MRAMTTRRTCQDVRCDKSRGLSIFTDRHGRVIVIPPGLTFDETMFIAENVSAWLADEPTDEAFDAFVKFAASRGINLFEETS